MVVNIKKNKTRKITSNIKRFMLLVSVLGFSSTAQAIDPYPTGINGRFSGDIQNNYIDDGLKGMTKELTHVIMSHAAIVGSYFDAKQQLENQQTYQTLVAEAHKDYRPSDTMCRYGTYMRSVAASESKADMNELMLSQSLLNQYTSEKHSIAGIASQSQDEDLTSLSFLRNYKQRYCDPSDNDLDLMCQNYLLSLQSKNMNRDVSYSRVLGSPLTVDVDYVENTSGNSQSEKDIYALAKHLYYGHGFNPINKKKVLRRDELYSKARSLMAMLSVAHSSFVHMVGHKSRAPEFDTATEPGWNFMKAMMQDFNIPDEEIHMIMGDFPSYHAQMEVLTKKIYQNPEFYTNLYETPANVKRVSASMEAISLMQARDAYESSLREEMMYSMLIERAVMKKAETLQPKLGAL